MSDVDQKVLEEVRQERERARTIWTEEQDDVRDASDWYALLGDYNSMAHRRLLQGHTDAARRKLIQIAAIAIAEVQRLDRL